MSWAHRNRLQQTVYLVTQSEASIGPEPGTTYTVRIYGESGALRHAEVGIAGASWAYALTTEIAESTLGRPNETVTVEVESVRDGYTSWQAQRIQIPECRGYGMTPSEPCQFTHARVGSATSLHLAINLFQMIRYVPAQERGNLFRDYD